MSASRRALAIAEWVLVASALFLLGFVVVHGIWGDAAFRFENLEELLERGQLKPRRWEGAGYSLVGPLFSAPLYLLGKLLGSPRPWVSHFNACLVAAFALASLVLLRKRVEGVVLRRFALLVLGASMFPFHSAAYYAEVFSAVFAAAGLAAVAFGHRVVGWAAVVLASVNVPALLVPLALVCAWVTWTERSLRHLLPILAGGLLYLAESWLRRGSPLETYYLEAKPPVTLMPYSGRPGFSYPMLAGVLAILFSFGKGLVFYAPGVFLPWRTEEPSLEPVRKVQRLFIVFLVGMVLVYSKWWAWNGDWFWGPRFFLFASIPACVVLCVRLAYPSASLADRVLTLGALLLSCWVAVNGIAFHTSNMELCFGESGKYGAYCHFTLEYSALWRPLVVAPPLDWRQKLFLGHGAAVALVLGAPLVVAVARELVARFRRCLDEVRLSAWRL